MQIPQTDIDNAINGIVQFFERRIKTTLTKQEFQRIQTQSVDQLDGLEFLFIDNRKIKLQITDAKLQILAQQIHREGCHAPISKSPRMDNSGELEQSSDACRPPALSPVEVGQGGTLSNQPKSGDKKPPPVLSPENSGQGATFPCSSCNGLGIDEYDISHCDDCLGTGRQVVYFPDHDSGCQCLSCQPYGPGLEPNYKIPDYEGVL